MSLDAEVEVEGVEEVLLDAAFCILASPAHTHARSPSHPRVPEALDYFAVRRGREVALWA